MLRVIITLLCTTTAASAATPPEFPKPAIPSPAIPELGSLHYGRSGAAAAPSFKYRPIVSYCRGGVITTSDYPQNVMGLIELFGSEVSYRRALDSTRIEVVRLTRRFNDADKPADYAEGEAVMLHGWQGEIIQQAITDDASYNWDGEFELFESAPVYDLRIRLHHGDKTVTADLSLSAQTIRIHENFAIVAEQPLSERGLGLLLALDRPQH